MRTHKKHGLLLCGVAGAKVYFKDEAFTIVIGRKSYPVEGDKYLIVRNYVNLKYAPIDSKNKIVATFLALIEQLKGN